MIGDPLFMGVSPPAQQNLVKDSDFNVFSLFFLTDLITGTFPIDTTKTRLQIQGQKLDGRFTAERYNGMLHALSRIRREEGVRALYSGYN